MLHNTESKLDYHDINRYVVCLFYILDFCAIPMVYEKFAKLDTVCKTNGNMQYFCQSSFVQLYVELVFLPCIKNFAFSITTILLCVLFRAYSYSISSLIKGKPCYMIVFPFLPFNVIHLGFRVTFNGEYNGQHLHFLI